jgi:biotin transport system ATP-binding protein
MLQASDLSFSYPSSVALSGLSFRVQAGEAVALLGANGSGKSTLLTLLSGLNAPGSGQVRVNDLISPGQEKGIRQQVGLLLQDAELQILGATVGEDILLGQRGGNGQKDPGLARGLAARFGLLEAWDRAVHTLSGGQKRKLCLAAMLLRQPSVLLFDEPFSGLDYPASLELRQHIRTNQELGLTQVIAVHDVEPVADLVSRFMVLDHGILVHDGCGEEVMDRLPDFGIRPPCSWLARGCLTSW